jgi:hypothetical protein
MLQNIKSDSYNALDRPKTGTDLYARKATRNDANLMSSSLKLNFNNSVTAVKKTQPVF